MADKIQLFENQPIRTAWVEEEGSQLVTSCNQLKMTAKDGKKRLTDVANTEQLHDAVVGLIENIVDIDDDNI